MASNLRSRLGEARILLVPGVYDALSGLLAQQAGAEAVYLSGASIAYTRFGRPDLGLVAMSEVADTLALLADRIAAPIIVDADTGYGNALNVQRTVRTFERAGAAAIQLEDQVFPKRCGHLSGKSLIPKSEMAGKIEAACDARASDQTLIIARSDAAGVNGLDDALARARAYEAAGADILFVEAPGSADDLKRIAGDLKGLKPLMANMVEGGQTPLHTAAELGDMGFSIAIFPGGLVRAQARHAQNYFKSLLENGSNRPFADNMLDFDGLNDVLETQAMLDLGAGYGTNDGEAT
jgi:2-methylisocitrate lyase-like PEP mutase family enzyme